ADGSAVGLFQRGRLVVPVPRDVAGGARLRVRARASAAFGGWPYLLVEAMRADGSERAFVGFVRVADPAWHDVTIRLLSPLRAGHDLHVFYANDAWDAERQHDRNVWLRDLVVLPPDAP